MRISPALRRADVVVTEEEVEFRFRPNVSEVGVSEVGAVGAADVEARPLPVGEEPGRASLDRVPLIMSTVFPELGSTTMVLGGA